MTAVSALNLRRVAARPEEDRLEPVQWRQMVWVTWRQHRVALIGVAAVLGVMSLYLWIGGLQLHRAYAAVVACHPTGSYACQNAVGTFEHIANWLSNGFLLQAIPALIGVFLGAPLLAREFESGTFRFAWTQAVGRWRWTVAKLVLLSVGVVAATGAFSALVTWYYAPYFAQDNQSLSILSAMNPYFPGLFNLHGITLPTWTLASFAIGVLAGVLIRRVVPAIVVSLAAYTGLSVLTVNFLRPHYLTPVVSSGSANVPSNAWILSQWLEKGGATIAWPPPISILQQACPQGPSGPYGKSSTSFAGCLAQHGYSVFVSYHPGSQFWSFQWIEAGWLFGLSALLVAITVWIVRRRPA